jgi:hypothetical protein
MYGPLAALYSELFPTRSRYTGASLGYQFAGIGAGLAPVVFAGVLAGTGTPLAVATIIAACCLVSVGCILVLGETSRINLTEVDASASRH